MKHFAVKKGILVILMFILLYGAFYGIFTMKMVSVVEESLLFGQTKLASIQRLLEESEEKARVSAEWITENLYDNIRLTTTMLREFVSGSTYTGPRLLEDGAVVELEGGKVIFPEEMSVTFRLIKSDDASAGNMELTAESVRNMAEEPVEAILHDSSDGRDERIYLVSGELSDTLYYMDWTTRDEVQTYLVSHITLDDIWANAENVFGGRLLKVSASGEILIGSSMNPDAETLEDYALTPDQVREKQKLITDSFSVWVVSYLDVGNEYTLIFMDPFNSFIATIGMETFLVVLLMGILLAGTLVWNFSVQSFVRDMILTQDQMKRYAPGKMRIYNLAIAISGAAFILASAFCINTAGMFQSQARSFKNTLYLLDSHLADSVKDLESKSTNEEEEWFIYYGHRMASLISRYPALGDNEMLRRYSEILSAEYIMLFNSNGEEVASSNDYAGFRLAKNKIADADSYDFRRLLLGITGIVHPASKDKATGLTLQMIGVNVPPANPGNKHGALIIALDPARTTRIQGTFGINEQLDQIAPAGYICFAVDPDTSIVVYASEETLLNRSLSDTGFDVRNVRGDVIDQFIVDGIRYFGVSRSQEGLIYYFGSPVNYTEPLHYGFLACVVFLILYLILAVPISYGYTTKWFEEHAREGQIRLNGAVVEVVSWDGSVRRSVDPSKRWTLSSESWKNMLPEQKTGVIIRSFGILAIILCLMTYSEFRIGKFSGTSLLSFIMQGNWTKGPNIFAAFAILFTVLVTLLVLFICKYLMIFFCRISGTKAETVIRLVYNLLQYVLLFAAILISCWFLGIDTTTVIAPIAILSLAVSLGSKDLMADILAGISIVFEGEFQVGDIIDVGGYKGVVQEIGVRSTKIIGQGDNVKIIGNNDIKNVINMTRLNSWYPVSISVPITEPLLKVEEILTRELPEIGKKNNRIIGGPFYKGVETLSGGSMTLLILTECKEYDYDKVKRFINRELRIVFEREDIELR